MAEDDPAGSPPPRLDTFAARLEYLFDTLRPTAAELGNAEDVGRSYTNKEIADKINARATESGTTISAAYIGELRRGVAADPRASHIRALAQAFGVQPGYFVDDEAARRIQEQIALLNELRRMDVTQVALRQVLSDTGLSSASAQVVEQMVCRLREVESSGGDPDQGRNPPADVG